MPLVASRGGAAASGFGFGNASNLEPGMVLLKPTSIDFAGTSASIGTNGSVTFSAITSLSLNGVFSASFDNYVIMMRQTASGGDNNINARLRTSGTDDTGSNYTWQYFDLDGTGIAPARVTVNRWRGGLHYSSKYGGDNLFIYGPFLSRQTAYRLVNVAGWQNGSLFDAGGTHSLSTSYDGITFYPTVVANITGALRVYGVRK